METKFKDVIQHYIGCEIQYPNTDGGKPIVAKLTGFSRCDGAETTYKRKRNGCAGDYIGFDDGKERGHECYIENIKPLLRPLSDMTIQEQADYADICNVAYQNAKYPLEDKNFGYSDPRLSGAAQTLWLLSKSFDLFNLIPSGQAISKTLTVNEK